MTREEQIYKKAEGDCIAMLESIERGDIIKGSICPQSYRAGFMDGAEWADSHPQWIPVEERLPEERKVVWVRKHFNKEVLGEFDIYDSAAFCNGEFQCDNSCTITHWMPIVPPRKEVKNET